MASRPAPTAPDRSYRRFHAWKHAFSLTVEVYSVTQGWPPAERFGLISQCRHAAISAVANIAEGSARRGPKEFARFLDMAFASLAELQCLLDVVTALRFINLAEAKRLEEIRCEASRTTWGLLRAMRSRNKNK